jgi:beta-lactam-binding protein with PASTA domain
LLLLLLVGVGLAGAYLLTRDEDAGGSENRVPNVVGETVTDAVRELGQRGYPADVRGQISRTQVGRVLAQEPDPGEELDRGERVVLVVARSPLTVEVPRVVGSPVGDAFERLQASRLRGREIKVATNKPRGIVVKQQPTAGAEVRRGSLVVLSVSKGQRIVTVPLVEGLKQQAALARLKQALLDAKVVNVPAREPAGTVIAQSPKAGTRVPSGPAVQINVAGAVPGSTTRRPRPGRRRSRTWSGPATRRPWPASSRPFPRAVDCRLLGPAHGDRAHAVSGRRHRGPARHDREADRLGRGEGSGRAKRRRRTEVDARGILRAAGFPARPVDRAITDPAQDGRVVEQNPAAGTRVQGSTGVVIFVGRLTR